MWRAPRRHQHSYGHFARLTLSLRSRSPATLARLSTRRDWQRSDPLEHRPEQPPGQVALRQQELVIPGGHTGMPASAYLDDRVLCTEALHGASTLLAGGHRIRALDVHLLASRHLVPKMFELNGGVDVSLAHTVGEHSPHAATLRC